MRSFEALVSLFETSSGGRKGWITSGYRPPLRVGDVYFDGSFALSGDGKMYPGDRNRKAIITVIDDAQAFPLLSPGSRFEITEGPDFIVGEGIVLGLEESKTSKNPEIQSPDEGPRGTAT